CGNGARCFARFVRLKGLTNKRDIRVSTANGRMVLTVTDDDLVRVNMGEPNFEPSAVPFGSEVAQCGNGARCFARFVRLKGLTNKRDIRVSTANGRMV
ncbi:hypothetical protein CQA09_28385, partial [Klebsiella pneumoniae]